MSRMIDISGRRFGRLTAIRAFDKRYRRFRWICQCDCGAIVIVDGNGLRQGNTKSCGCLALEETSKRSFRHGDYGSPEYQAWGRMISRCTNPKVERYPNYGGRGIGICERWRTNFMHFLNDMGRKPTPQHTLGRKNNDGDYEPLNCRWETRVEQMNNTTRNRFITHDGRTQTLAQWSRETGIKEATIMARLKDGWDVDKSLTTPTRKHRDY